MRSLATSIVALGVFMTPPFIPAQVKATTLDALHDQRVLLVFGNGDNQQSEAQLDVAAKHADGFRDRQLILAGLTGSDPAVPTVLLSPSSDQAARQRFHVKAGEFTVVLIGKDGGEKMRSNHPIAWETLQDKIDAMPMRRDEIHR